MRPLEPREKGALSGIEALLADDKRILTTWQDDELFEELDNVGLQLRVGGSGSPQVAGLVQRYESGREFPPLLRALLSQFDGMNIEEVGEEGITLVREPSVRDVWNGWLAAVDVAEEETSDPERVGVRFATAEARLLLVENGEVIFDDAKDRPVVVASDLASFLDELAQCGLSVEAVVARYI